MNFFWYNIFNLDEFLEDDLASRLLPSFIDGVGQKNILITKGAEVSVVYEDVVMPIEFEGENPFVREGSSNTYAVYKDQNNDIWLGIKE